VIFVQLASRSSWLQRNKAGVSLGFGERGEKPPDSQGIRADYAPARQENAKTKGTPTAGRPKFGVVVTHATRERS